MSNRITPTRESAQGIANFDEAPPELDSVLSAPLNELRQTGVDVAPHKPSGVLGTVYKSYESTDVRDESIRTPRRGNRLLKAAAVAGSVAMLYAVGVYTKVLASGESARYAEAIALEHTAPYDAEEVKTGIIHKGDVVELTFPAGESVKTAADTAMASTADVQELETEIGSEENGSGSITNRRVLVSKSDVNPTILPLLSHNGEPTLAQLDSMAGSQGGAPHIPAGN